MEGPSSLRLCHVFGVHCIQLKSSFNDVGQGLYLFLAWNIHFLTRDFAHGFELFTFDWSLYEIGRADFENLRNNTSTADLFGFFFLLITHELVFFEI